MRALITGASGFIGSYLTRRLLSAGVPVAIVHRRDSDLWRLRDDLSGVVRIEGDLLDLEAIESSIAEFKPDTFFHLAWFGVNNKQRNDDSQLEKNLYSSLALVRLAGKLGCRNWIGAGSQAEYGPQNQSLTEASTTAPTTLYGATKLSVYFLASQMAKNMGLRFAWVRVFSTYGPQDNPDWMLPYVIRLLKQGATPALTPAAQRWDYLHVMDAAEAFYQIAITPQAQGLFNLGSGQSRPLKEIIEFIRDQIDPELPLGFGQVPYRPDQVMFLEANVAKLRKETNWIPRISLEEGLRETIRLTPPTPVLT